MSHPLHLSIAKAIGRRLDSRFELVRDPACGGNHHLPLFVGKQKGRATRMCCVDLLVLEVNSKPPNAGPGDPVGPIREVLKQVLGSGTVRVIVEIEESGFLPTKICGKLLQAALATHFIHDTRREGAIPYSDQVLFVQVLDGSKCLKPGTRKDAQAELIEREIRVMMPLRGITDYRLLLVQGESDLAGIDTVASVVCEMNHDS